MKQSNSKDEDVQEREKLQAVLLADRFGRTTLRPLDLEQHPTQLLLNNVPLMEYVLHSCAVNGVEELFVVSGSEDVATPESSSVVIGGMQIHVVKDSSLTNAGDALRELYRRNVVTSDPFLLYTGDVVTNMELKDALVAHKQRKDADSSAIMTLVLQETGNNTGGFNQDLCIAMDPTQQNRILSYSNAPNTSKVALPCSFFAAHSRMQIHTDLQDTSVCICSPDVLAKFEDEFDFLEIAQDPFQRGLDFVSNCVAEEEEGLQTRIHAHILPPSEYASRVLDFPSYHQTSQELLKRWMSPIKESYKQTTTTDHSYYFWKEIPGPLSNHNTKVARSAHLYGPGMMASPCSIGEASTIKKSVLGKHCVIGNHCQVESSHLFENVTVKDGATIFHSILAKHVKILEGAVVSKGCVLGQGVVIGKGVVLKPFTRITTCENEDDQWGQDDDNDGFSDDSGFSDDDDEDDAKDDAAMVNKNTAQTTPSFGDKKDDVNVVGPDGKGHVWKPNPQDHNDSDEDDSEDGDCDIGLNKTRIVLELTSIGGGLQTHHQQRQQKQALADVDDFSLKNAQEEQEQMESEAFSAYTDGTINFDAPAIPQSGVVFGRQKGVDVVQELMDICMEFEETSPMENLAIELNSYKFSQNATYSDCTMASILAILEKMQITPEMSDGKLISSLNSKLNFWAPLLQKMSISTVEEQSIIFGLERAATTTLKEKLATGPSFRFLLQTLHDKEVLSEEAILAWKEERLAEDAESPLGKLFHLSAIQEFLEWLEEEEEDSDDDDDSSED